MKKTFILSLIFIFSGLLLWAEDDRNNEKISVEKAVDDKVTLVVEDTPYDINVVVNDVSSGFSEIEITNPPHFGVLESQESGFRYIPNGDYYATNYILPADSFQYTLVFAAPTANQSAWVFIDSILGVNDTPEAVNDSFIVVQDSGLLYAPALANDIDHDRVGLQVKKLTTANHGTVEFYDHVFKTKDGAYVFFPNKGTAFNSNLDLSFDERDMSYMYDTVFVYEPDSGFYGYDSISYLIQEYRMFPMTLLPSVFEKYEFAHTEDIDTGTIVFYVEPHNYLPVAVNDTLKVITPTSSKFMKESKERETIKFLSDSHPLVNDLDPVAAPGLAMLSLRLPYILGHRSDSATATADNDTVVFYHRIAEYDAISQSIIYRQDSNIASINLLGDLTYQYAPGYSGVDSLYYAVVEKEVPGTGYPSRFRGDTSALGLIYFVVEPVNDVSIPFPDTLDFKFSELSSTSRLKNLQYFDILSNDLDVDDTDSGTLAIMHRLMGKDYKIEFETYGVPSVKLDAGLLETVEPASPGIVHLFNDGVFYNYKPLYGQELLIDSFQYVLYNGEESDTSEWAFIRHQAVDANDDILSISRASLIENKDDSTIASNLLLTGNDVSYDTIFILYDEDSLLKTPSKSDYAVIKKAELGVVNYYHNQGFTQKDSFQYIVSDLITNDTAWVFLNNAPCVAEDDVIGVQEHSLISGSYYEEIDVLANDHDPEDIKVIVPFDGDTLDTGNGLVLMSDDGILLNYYYQKTFFYKDSFTYTLTDVPALYAADNFFTQDSAWVYIVDTSFVLDSDSDGIVNTMEDNVEGYQFGEDTLDFDEDGIPNYLDNNVNGFPASGDCDGDGILNAFDKESDCDDIPVSTAFTPNGDGVNDYFVIPDIVLSDNSVMQASIKIYNRWGSIVYENNNYGQNNDDWWDGRLGNVQGVKIGNDLPNGVYLYYLVYNNGLSQKEGYVHIQR